MVLGPLPQRKELLDRPVILNHCRRCKWTMRIYTDSRAVWVSEESTSAKAGVAEGVTSILSRTRSVYHDTPLEVSSLMGWTWHICQLPGPAPWRPLLLGGAPLQCPGRGPSPPTPWCPSVIEPAHPAAPPRDAQESNIPSSHRWFVNHKP